MDRLLASYKGMLTMYRSGKLKPDSVPFLIDDGKLAKGLYMPSDMRSIHRG